MIGIVVLLDSLLLAVLIYGLTRREDVERNFMTVTVFVTVWLLGWMTARELGAWLCR